MQDIKEFIKNNEENIKRDIKRLVNVRSVAGTPTADAPNGEGVKEAQRVAEDILKNIGLKTRDLDGRVGFGHYGDEERFLGIIAHVDVVPEGNGWLSDPYDCIEKEGYLVGRGTLDDKGAFVLSAYAVKYLIDNKIPLNYGIRIIIGLDEETGMSDVEYYREHEKMPLFTFTPDAGFPVGHGEKGIYSADLVSPAIKGGNIAELSGGVASNVVADYTYALIKNADFSALEKAAADKDYITVTREKDLIKVEARGKAGHAGEPHEAVNSNLLIMKYLLEAGALFEDEEAAAEFIVAATDNYDGDVFGIACDDGVFSPLSIIGGMLTLEKGRLCLNVNCRYPTAITAEELEKKISDTAESYGFTVKNVANSKPFYLDPEENAAVGIMCAIYNEVTRSDEKPIVMSGGTYARHIENAVSYGIEYPDQRDPEWVGGVHMKNEALKISRALESVEIFIKTLIKLQDVRF